MNDAALDFLLSQSLPKHKCYGELTVSEIFRSYEEERNWRASHAGKKLNDIDADRYARFLTPEGCLGQHAQLPKASYRTFIRWYLRIPEVARVMARKGNEAFANTQEIISWRDLGALQPMDFLVMDHRMLDIAALVPARGSWRLIRPWGTFAIDMRTRKWLAWAIVEVPSSDSIAAVLKKALIRYGIPKTLYIDNGRDFRAQMFEGKKETRGEAQADVALKDGWPGILESLGIRVTHSIVRRARSKIIEPAFRAVAEFDRSLPFWTGHKPTARPERFQRLLDENERFLQGQIAEPPFPTIEQVAAIYDDQMEALNERERVGAEGMNKITATGRGWLSPAEAFERFTANMPRREVPEDILQFAFRKRREVTVKHGEIRSTFAGQSFHYRMDDGDFRLMALNGVRLSFAYDPMDLETVAVYHENRFFGIANCVELRRMGESDFVGDERARRTARRETKNFIKAVHAMSWVPDYKERANRRREVLPARPDLRPAVAAPVSQETLEGARELAKQLKEFSFDAVDPANIISVANASAYRDDDDSAFQFFSDEKEA